MSRRENREKKQSGKVFRKIIIVAIFLAIICFIFKYAPNYVRDDITDRTNVILNNGNITKDLKQEVIIRDGVIYISKPDIYNFFDPYIYYDEQYNQIVTGADTRIASIVIGENIVNDNGADVKIKGSIIEKDNIYYLPFSELDNIYNVKIQYIEETDTVVIDSLDRRLVVADSSKNIGVKYRATSFSRNVDKIQRGDSVTIVNDSQKDGWVKVRTQNGKLGYVKETILANETVIREAIEHTKQIEGKISMFWDYIYEYSPAPQRNGKIKGVNVVSPTFFTLTRLGKGEVHENVGESGKAYINWAHSNGYKVWPSISNSAMIETTSEIMNDHKLRQRLINKIVSLVVKYDLDGINIDFENMYVKDKELFSRFIIELEPRLNEIGAVLSVDVTAPDGSDTWSMCYDRHTIGKVADYIVFMAYDQNGITSPKEGTTAGHDWVEVNLKKFVGTQEEVDNDKIILGIPFYTRIWWTNSNGEIKSEAVNINSLKNIIPSDASKIWDENLKQYVAEYTKYGTKYKVWIEDERSIEEKLNLVQEYELAGAAYWKKDGETEQIWELISNKLGI